MRDDSALRANRAQAQIVKPDADRHLHAAPCRHTGFLQATKGRNEVNYASAGTAGTSVSERRAQNLFAGFFLLFSLALFAGYLAFQFHAGFAFNDFFVFWAGAKFVGQAPLAQLYDPAAFHAFELGLGQGEVPAYPYVYPPISMFLFRPFALLSFHAAWLAWNALGLALYLAGVRALLKTTALSLLAAFVAPATVIALTTGQTGLYTSAFALLGVAALRKNPPAAGLAIGLLAVKPQLALLPFLVLLLPGQRKAAACALVTVIVLLGSSVAVFGLDAWPAWLHAMSGFAGSLSASQAHHEYGVSVYFSLLHLGLFKSAALTAQAFTLAAILYALYRALQRGYTAPQQMAILTGTFLATPYAVVYDLPAVSAVCLLLYTEGRRGRFRPGELLTAAAAWCMPALLVFYTRASIIGLALLLALLLLALRRAGFQNPGLNEA